MTDGTNPVSEPESWQQWIERAQVPVLNHLASAQYWSPSEDDRRAAWVLFCEISTRISVARLRYRDGREESALDSMYKLFTRHRELITEVGHRNVHFSIPTSVVFEQVVRPFTAKWHGRKVSGALSKQDMRREFRRELRLLQDSLREFAVLLKILSGTDTVIGAHVDDQGCFEPSAIPADLYLGTQVRSEAFAEELVYIQSRRRNVYGLDENSPLGGLSTKSGEPAPGFVGLSLSGGGIRSATFCLGVVQSLVKHGVFEDIDYLSTVSGGGYLGGFITVALSPVAGDALDADTLLTKPDGRTGDSKKARWLRNNSKYLIGGNKRERRQTRKQLLKMLLPGGSTLHEYYRDKLAGAYLNTSQKLLLSTFKSPNSSAPYPIINTAVNLPGSNNTELRGRNSDFFAITPHHVGSVTTGYCTTEQMEAANEEFDLAMAIATSGAAVSPHMGMKTKRIAASLLAAANLRLGTWVPNPAFLSENKKTGRLSPTTARLREFRGLLSEEYEHVNLADGGFVENLGVYELLRRRCKFIIAVDGECDRGRTCAALIKATRLAAIDFGAKIDIDYSELTIEEEELSQAHFSFGTIDYGNDEIGYLLYIKSSLTGNEPSYVREYRTKNPSFPHETTADQLFDESQFEAYRALGEHAANDLFSEEFVTRAALAKVKFRSRIWLESLVRELL